MGPSSASNLSSSAFNGYMLTPLGYKQLQRTLDKMTGGQVPMSHFNFSHSVLNGVHIWKLKLMDAGAILAHLYPSGKTAPAMDYSTLRLSYATAMVQGKLTYGQSRSLEMYMTPYMQRYERHWLLTLLKVWMSLGGGLHLDTSRVHFSSDRP